MTSWAKASWTKGAALNLARPPGAPRVRKQRSGRRGTGQLLGRSRAATTAQANRTPLYPTVLVSAREAALAVPLPAHRILPHVMAIMAALVRTTRLTFQRRKPTEPRASSSSRPSACRAIMLKPRWSGSKWAKAPVKALHSSPSAPAILEYTLATASGRVLASQ